MFFLLSAYSLKGTPSFSENTLSNRGGAKMEEKKTMRARSQNMVIESRRKVSITGVLDVPRFSETTVILKTDLGKVVIKGTGFRVTRLDLDNALAEFEGTVNSVDYAGRSAKKVFLQKR